MDYVLSIDQGTSSSRGVIYDEVGNIHGIGSQALPSSYPQDGWVEQDPEQIWQSTLAACRLAIEQSKCSPTDIRAIGITNQRETTVVWRQDTGQPVHNAIVWQDRRTADLCQKIVSDGLEHELNRLTGLVVDPYFSSTKLAWLLSQSDIRDLAERGLLRFGTVDSFLIWRLTKGKDHVCDATNASRTQLYDIVRNEWSNLLLDYFSIPTNVLPDVKNSADEFGVTDKEWFGHEIPILGVAGDQQAAMIGQACFDVGMTKSTYGTGCFVMMNSGSTVHTSTSGLLTTVGYRVRGKTTYALEGSIFCAGSAIKWLRDKLHLINVASDSEESAQRIDGDTRGVTVVPAFTGLGAPHWNPDARGLICGLTLDTGPDEIVTATLKSIAHQTSDLLRGLQDDGIKLGNIRVDGGMVENNWFCQFLADLLDRTVERPTNIETTSAGAAMLAWLGSGHFSDLNSASNFWASDRVFMPEMNDTVRRHLMDEWNAALQRAI